MSTVKQFEAGKTYTTRSICDHETIIRVSVASRTPHTIKTTEGKTFRTQVYDGAEYVKPWGSYSMAPIVRADRGEIVTPAPAPAPPAEVKPAAAPAPVLRLVRATASWVIKRKADGQVITETYSQLLVDKLNTAVYEAVPIQDHLASLSSKPAEVIA